MTVRILTGDWLEVLRTLPSESVHCVVTSPPYFGLRDYGTSTWEMPDGAPAPEMFECEDCDIVRHISTLTDGCPKCGETMVPHGHDRVGARGGRGGSGTLDKRNANAMPSTLPAKSCSCGALNRDHQVGLESTPEAFVAKLVEGFREVRRVLRKDGTCWLNLGDSYAGSGKGPSNSLQSDASQMGNVAQDRERKERAARNGYAPGSNFANYGLRNERAGILPSGLKPKDLLGIPWMVAFALRADGWYLRSDIIWSKPNPMPESVTDRPTRAHEYLFLLSKSRQYFFDQDAVREPQAESTAIKLPYGRRRMSEWKEGANGSGIKNNQSFNDATTAAIVPGGRNIRSVWTIATAPFPQAHFATYPVALVEPCIRAGSSEKGCCPVCGAPILRQTTTELVPTKKAARTFVIDARDHNADSNDQGSNRQKDGHKPGHINAVTTVGWRPSCTHHEASSEPVPCTVLDPFFGAGTTGLVADRLGRDCIGVELSPAYAAMARARLTGDSPMFTEVVA